MSGLTDLMAQRAEDALRQGDIGALYELCLAALADLDAAVAAYDLLRLGEPR